MIHSTQATQVEVFSKSRNPFNKRNKEFLRRYGELIVIPGKKSTVTVTEPKPVEPKPVEPKQNTP